MERIEYDPCMQWLPSPAAEDEVLVLPLRFGQPRLELLRAMGPEDSDGVLVERDRAPRLLRLRLRQDTVASPERVPDPVCRVSSSDGTAEPARM